MGRVESSPVVDRIINWSLNTPLSAPTRYLAATLLVVGMAVLRAALITEILPWLLFIPVILMVSLTMGRRTGFYSVGLSALAAALSIGSPGAPLWLTSQQWVATGLFIVVCGMIAVVGAELRAAFRRAKLSLEERQRLAAEKDQASAELARTYDLLVAKEEQGRLLNNELGHRLKNLLSILQAVVGQTLRQSTDLKSASDALFSRLAAFGRAADVLTASTWETAELHTLAHTALDNHSSLAARFRIDGPRIRFNSQVALALALAFHELATNAIKYGALSNDTGHVDLTWAIEPGPNGGEPRFRLTWREAGGPPVVPPSRRGFGSLMIERSLRSYFRGETLIRYEPDGVVFTIDAPLAGARAEVVE